MHFGGSYSCYVSVCPTHGWFEFVGEECSEQDVACWDLEWWTKEHAQKPRYCSILGDIVVVNIAIAIYCYSTVIIFRQGGPDTDLLTDSLPSFYKLNTPSVTVAQCAPQLGWTWASHTYSKDAVDVQ
ncbi:uncharacterized protein EI90DRAFT_3013375 [Cantharellus anzutake]|uniref:uncharacterized protein n=1 Tax=Cantharellus anzutake TaxID=1750568 RepID=UPI0019044630|nr:uncharacterized protein EI90DRAFT_3013375 [Cantharellus anzutake]KAF8338043.1 hypothetical protein EI90DRAFT_3013375 [Cantharellus anzutake]